MFLLEQRGKTLLEADYKKRADGELIEPDGEVMQQRALF
jgi:hypothetical protein